MLIEVRRKLTAVLADLEFPAFRWQVVACAHAYGADGLSRCQIARLPERQYGDLSEICAAIVRGDAAGVDAPAGHGRSREDLVLPPVRKARLHAEETSSESTPRH